MVNVPMLVFSYFNEIFKLCSYFSGARSAQREVTQGRAQACQVTFGIDSVAMRSMLHET